MDNPPVLFSDKQARQNRKRLLNRLKKSYRVAHLAWQACNYYDFVRPDRVLLKAV